MLTLEKSWFDLLEEELQHPFMQKLQQFLQQEVRQHSVYPDLSLVFNAFNKTPFNQVKVVIIGQDPYHGPSQAHGLAFSVPKNVPPPPSLKNIFQEIHADLNLPIPSHGCLESWAHQGVFLLNSTLTVRQGLPKSHHGYGWELFTDSVVKKLAQRKDPIVFLLWGKSAQEKGAILKNFSQHRVLNAAHPSPFSAHKFFGCRHFSKTNNYLKSWGKKAIDWNL